MSEAGRHHGYDHARNQDRVLYRKNSHYCAAVLADGVSTCAESAEGAKVACEAMAEYLLLHARRFFEMSEQEAADHLLSHIRFQLQETAAESEKTIEAFSSTAACILFDRSQKRMLYFSVGDSLILVTEGNRCQVIAQPGDSREGCCVTTTSNAAAMAKVGVVDAQELDSVLICSDGAWHLMYQKNRMEDTVRSLLLAQDFAGLEELLAGKERMDDCSFISVGLKKLHRRRSM